MNSGNLSMNERERKITVGSVDRQHQSYKTEANNTVVPQCILSLFHWLDFNECKDKATENCHVNAVCNNKDGSFDCKCKDGYQGDGVTTCGKETTSRFSLQ